MARQTVSGRPGGCSCLRVSGVTVWRVGGADGFGPLWCQVSAPLFPSPLRNPPCYVFCPCLPRGGHPPPAFVRWNYWYIFTWRYERFSSLLTRFNLLLWTSEYALWPFQSLLTNGRRGLEGGVAFLVKYPCFDHLNFQRFLYIYTFESHSSSFFSLLDVLVNEGVCN